LEYRDERFEWDVEKSEDCYRRRYFDFAYAARIFDSDYYYEEIDERDYGDEERNICVGTIDERSFTVVYTPRGTRKRIISAWFAEDREVKKYAHYFEAAK
jgi:uncharacterized DUF497 family protein